MNADSQATDIDNQMEYSTIDSPIYEQNNFFQMNADSQATNIDNKMEYSAVV